LACKQLALELMAGHDNALIFSQFTDFLKLLAERLDSCGITYQTLDGSTPTAERGKRVAAFQRGEGDLCLISLKAGGFGLNLTARTSASRLAPTNWGRCCAGRERLGALQVTAPDGVTPWQVHRCLNTG